MFELSSDGTYEVLLDTISVSCVCQRTLRCSFRDVELTILPCLLAAMMAESAARRDVRWEYY